MPSIGASELWTDSTAPVALGSDWVAVEFVPTNVRCATAVDVTQMHGLLADPGGSTHGLPRQTRIGPPSSYQATETLTSFAPGLPGMAPPLLAYVAVSPLRPANGNVIPFAFTVKFVTGTRLVPSSRSPQSTWTETSYLQSVAPRGSTPKYPSPGFRTRPGH